MIYRTPLVLAAVAVLSASSFAQNQRSALGVRIQATFRAADVNKNGTVSVREAAAAGIPAASFAKYDLNKDRRLSSNEFGKYYQHLMVVRRKDQAKRVSAKQAKRVGRSFKPVGTTSKPTPLATPKPKVLPAAPQGKPAKTKTPLTAPVQPVAAPVQSEPVAAVQPTVQPTGKSIQKNREVLQAEAVGKRYVKGLQSKGKLNASQAKEFIDVLTLPVPGKNAAENFREWRTALNNARERIGALVRAKALTAVEGREMYLLFEQRAKDAIGWQETGGVTEITPPAKVSGTKQLPKVRGQVSGKVAGKAPRKNTALGKPATGTTSSDEAAAKKAALARTAAEKSAHDRKRVEAARVRLAEQQAKELLAKKLRLKELEAKADGAKKASKGQQVPKAGVNPVADKGTKAAPRKPVSRGGKSKIQDASGKAIKPANKKSAPAAKKKQ